MVHHESSDRSSSCIDSELCEPLSVVLSSDYYQQILSVLGSDDGPQSIERLAATIAATETGNVADESTEGSKENALVLLYHWYLPKLADNGVVEYDAEDGETTLTARGVRCADVLEVLPDE